ncbi:M23 family metallopeptidase [Argonema antarcticum]|uniref:M23 family metallopeptidase n=1 Tax=Argonema antarcticum TaxID=2942763 RepID=UPI0020130E45|nr:M23 family metallopeptidase [Argonema antarcticum]MCL1470033.1 M23 family metallopeptidase [Argonema antarcticum A004/B2]
MKKSLLATAFLVFLLTLLPACFGKEKTASAPSTVETAANPPNSFKLGLPINCTLGQDCFIMHYVDRDPSPTEVDFGCGRQTYDGHNGVDFAIPDERIMAAGVAVKAAAAGKVLRVRDGVPDRRVADQTDKGNVQGIECGNGVVIDHGNGWQTQYCHLRNGSIVVKPDTSVEAGTVLGMVGESGLASFPHVHLTVRYQDKVVDPFVGANAGPGCRVDRKPIWQQPISYVPTGTIRAGFATQPPDMAAIWSGRFSETELPQNSPALIFWVQAYGVLKGDRQEFQLIAPDGKPFAVRKQELQSPSRSWLSYVGKRASGNQPLSPGVWRGEYRLIRDGKVLIDVKREVQVR